ncbi:MAG: RNA polymerase factor sigma-54 [Planctomycetes bacterium]|nr:RNA polymerase factor sigma-54 [Planctomycetota bacterium]
MSPDLKMRQSIGQFQRLEQKMLLTPQLIQSVALLQLPVMELSQKIEEMLEDNPFLEIREETSAGDEAATELEEQEWVNDQEATDAIREEHPESSVPKADSTSSEAADADAEDFSRVDKMEKEDDFELFRDNRPLRSLEDDPRWDVLQNTPDSSESLYEHLRSQIDTSDVPGRTRSLALRIASMLDKDGYLRIPLEEALAPSEDEIADGSYVPPSPEEADEAFRLIRRLDPAGIGAVDLHDCLILQLNDRHEESGLLYRIVDTQLDNVLHNRLPKVASALKVDVEDIKKSVESLKRLNPFPGRLYSRDQPQYVSPDIIVRRDGDDFEVVVNESYLPSIRIVNPYKGTLESGNEESREFLKRKYQEARQLYQNIEQRRSTLYRIASKIVASQAEFLEKGEAFLKPMQMQDVAGELGLHVSTISRAVADKYIDTPIGVFPLRNFFSAGYAMNLADADPHATTELSNQAVINMVSEIVAQEDKRYPLADKAIADILKDKGLNIARRTVAKYREKSGILPARQRRQY